MQAGEAGVAAVLIAVGFFVGWGATGAMLPAEAPATATQQPSQALEATSIARPAARAVPKPLDHRALDPASIEAAPIMKRRLTLTPALAPQSPPQPLKQAEPQPPKQAEPQPLEAADRELSALRASPKSVAQFERAYAEIKRATQTLPADRRGRVLTAINAANLTGDVEALARGLELLRAELAR